MINNISAINNVNRRNISMQNVTLFAKFLGKLKTAYNSILKRVGDPLEDGVLYGPLHNQQAVDKYKVYAIVPISFK